MPGTWTACSIRRTRTKEYLSVRYSMPPLDPGTVACLVHGRSRWNRCCGISWRKGLLQCRCNLHQASREDLKRIAGRRGCEGRGEPARSFTLRSSDLRIRLSGEPWPAFRRGTSRCRISAPCWWQRGRTPREGDYVIDVCAAPGGKSASSGGSAETAQGWWRPRDLSDSQGWD